MPFHDTDAERRNLVVATIGFLLFFWGGGELKSDSLKLPMFNVEFSRPGVVGFLAWVALFWFLYRYWLKHSFVFLEQFETELRDPRYISKAGQYASNVMESPVVTDTEEGFHIDRLYWKWNGFHADFVYAIKVDRNSDTGCVSTLTGHDQNQNGSLRFSGLDGWKVALQITGSCMFSKPSFSSYLVPYMLFSLVVISGIFTWVF